MSGAGLNDNRVGVLDLETGESRLLFPGARPFWISSGHILFFHAGRYPAADGVEVSGHELPRASPHR